MRWGGESFNYKKNWRNYVNPGRENGLSWREKIILLLFYVTFFLLVSFLFTGLPFLIYVCVCVYRSIIVGDFLFLYFKLFWILIFPRRVVPITSHRHNTCKHKCTQHELTRKHTSRPFPLYLPLPLPFYLSIYLFLLNDV